MIILSFLSELIIFLWFMLFFYYLHKKLLHIKSINLVINIWDFYKYINRLICFIKNENKVDYLNNLSNI